MASDWWIQELIGDALILGVTLVGGIVATMLLMSAARSRKARAAAFWIAVYGWIAGLAVIFVVELISFRLLPESALVPTMWSTSVLLLPLSISLWRVSKRDFNSD